MNNVKTLYLELEIDERLNVGTFELENKENHKDEEKSLDEDGGVGDGLLSGDFEAFGHEMEDKAEYHKGEDHTVAFNELYEDFRMEAGEDLVEHLSGQLH